jgi:hypothetical protein
MSKLSKKERQRIIEILNTGEDLPVDYKHILSSEESLCNNLWNDIPAYSFGNNYPTEKSEVLLGRIINMVGSRCQISGLGVKS